MGTPHADGHTEKIAAPAEGAPTAEEGNRQGISGRQEHAGGRLRNREIFDAPRALSGAPHTDGYTEETGMSSQGAHTADEINQKNGGSQDHPRDQPNCEGVQDIAGAPQGAIYTEDLDEDGDRAPIVGAINTDGEVRPEEKKRKVDRALTDPTQQRRRSVARSSKKPRDQPLHYDRAGTLYVGHVDFPLHDSRAGEEVLGQHLAGAHWSYGSARPP